MRFVLRALFILLCIPLAALAIYTGAAFGALLWAPRAVLPDQGIAIYACDNGVHTDLVVPVVAAGEDWRALFGAAAFAGPTEAYDHIGIGWGSREFYINTPTWSDLNVATAFTSVLWDETVIRIDYRPRPVAGENCRQWRTDEAGYGRIAGFIRGSLRLSEGLPVKAAPGYGARDAFFIGNGRYTIVATCNQWTAEALALIGAPVAPWAPFSFLVLWNLPMISS